MYRFENMDENPITLFFDLYNKERKLGQSLQIKIVFSLKVGAAPVGEALIDLFKKKAPTVKFREGWGMTELSPVVTSTRDDIFKPGSCGVLLPNTEAKIIDIESGEALGPNQQGELCIRGAQVSYCICTFMIEKIPHL